jgi:beta-1,4-mannosyl-glycoprotein beta-1,4-N-acetylglucosaminyltransferase
MNNMSKIYDAILFFNELDILDIRLNLLDPYVDYFIISECDYTFSGLPKKFLFEENKERYSKFLHKIIHIKNENSNLIDNIPNVHDGRKVEIFNEIIEKYNLIKNTAQTEFGAGHWCRDYLHREYTKLGMYLCNDNDIIIYSDTDEIPNPKILLDIKNMDLDKKYCFYQDNNNFYVNNISSTNWKGNIMTYYKNIKNISLNDLRKESRKEDSHDFAFIKDGGWHLSFMGDTNRIKEKIISYSHQEFNNQHILNNIENNRNNNRDIFFRGNNTYKSKHENFYFDSMKTVNIDGYFPENIVSLIKEKYSYLIK